jgi:hypothetical protein
VGRAAIQRRTSLGSAHNPLDLVQAVSSGALGIGPTTHTQDRGGGEPTASNFHFSPLFLCAEWLPLTLNS